MNNPHQTDVLIVGAGPIGLLTALTLTELGISVTIIDEEGQRAKHSYATALHPRSLRLLDRLGLSSEIESRGKHVTTVGFYDSSQQGREIDYSKLEGDFNSLVVLPQNELESVLRHKLSEKSVFVDWHHRLRRFKPEESKVESEIEELSMTSLGYVVQRFEWTVHRTHHLQSAFVIGCDGMHSLLRRQLAFDWHSASSAEHYAIFEFQSHQPICNDTTVILDESTKNVLWPLGNNRYRWSFQIPASEISDSPTTGLQPVFMIGKHVFPGVSRDLLFELLNDRVPWCKENIADIDWSLLAEFHTGVTTSYGAGRCWLAGDAAHLHSPIGIQGMNLGLVEADDFARKIAAILKDGIPLSTLQQYNDERLAEVKDLLGLTARVEPAAQSPSWAPPNPERLLSCIPATGSDLAGLIEQLGFQISRTG